ncbi:protein of unknown function [Methylocaldum szegediense]|uniref:Secreted protein n=1 Tax=Methylocaldum szegediense TaxID=73780 RepID=A0ABM9I9A5_9GAMM|nr:protein of unknown function [Methylocaldum szegediense]
MGHPANLCLLSYAVLVRSMVARLAWLLSVLVPLLVKLIHPKSLKHYSESISDLKKGLPIRFYDILGSHSRLCRRIMRNHATNRRLRNSLVPNDHGSSRSLHFTASCSE